MNIFQKYEKQLGYPAIAAIHVNTYNYESEEAVLESAALRNWLWDNYSIWVVVRFGNLPLFWWQVDWPLTKTNSNSKYFETAQQAYVDAFEAVLTAHDFLQHKNFQ
jgi:hypothetical protein